MIDAIEHYFIAGLYLRKMRLIPGESVVSHKHVYDHATIIASGTCLVWIDGKDSGLYEAGDILKVRANTQHRMEAQTSCEIICCHAVDPSAELDDLDNLAIGLIKEP